jgi:hypothetical protein
MVLLRFLSQRIEDLDFLNYFNQIGIRVEPYYHNLPDGSVLFFDEILLPEGTKNRGTVGLHANQPTYKYELPDGSIVFVTTIRTLIDNRYLSVLSVPDADMSKVKPG